MYPNKKEASLLVLSLIAIQIFASIYLAITGVYGREEGSNNLMYILVSLFSNTLIVRFALKRMGLRFSQLFHANANSYISMLMMSTLPVLFVLLGMDILLSNYFNLHFTLFPEETKMTKGLSESIVNGGILGFIAVCVVAPFVEEIVFRGVILRGLLSQYSQSVAILFSSMLFSLVHLNPDQLFSTWVFGIFSGWLYVKSYSLWPSILAHVISNSLVYVFAFSSIQIQGVNYFPSNEIVYASMPIQLLGVVLAVVGMYMLRSIFVSKR